MLPSKPDVRPTWYYTNFQVTTWSLCTYKDPKSSWNSGSATLEEAGSKIGVGTMEMILLLAWLEVLLTDLDLSDQSFDLSEIWWDNRLDSPWVSVIVQGPLSQVGIHPLVRIGLVWLEGLKRWPFAGAVRLRPV